MIFFDCHTHTSYSDGEASVDENVAAACAQGFSAIAITDHLAHPAFMDCAIDEEKITAYEADILAARLNHPNIEVIHGFEADYYPGCEADIEAAKGNATFLLGSIHYLDEYAIDWNEDMRAWESWGANGVWERYINEWIHACESSANFDSMAHPDIPRLISAQGYEPTINLAPLWKNMAEAAHDLHKHVELSTAALRNGLNDFYPQTELLECFLKAEVPLTLGSDAHLATNVGCDLDKAVKHAYKIGYRSIDCPTASGDWRRVPIQ